MFRRRILVLAALAVAACDVPTEPPMWEQTWMVPGEEITVGVADVLPAGVSVSADGSEFETTVPATGFVATLGEMCPDCNAVNGLFVTKPAFTYTRTMMTSLPASLLAASLTGDQFVLDLTHDLSFDPLRPGSATDAERGYVLFEVSSNGAVVARDSISGDDQAFPAGLSLGVILPTRAVDIAGSFDVVVTIYSPAGDPVQIDTSDTATIQLLPSTLSMSQATIEAGALAVSAVAAELDLSRLDSALVSRVQSGALRLDISNPFEVDGTLSLDFDLGSGTLRKSLPVAAGASSPSIAFTGAELQDLLAAGTVTVTAGGILSAPGGALTLFPDETMILESLLELVILVGGSGGES
ncbi:MAG: hypothetical protein KY466_03405 [Gemmatimonadetes bacterium]|nr:hypothetical protein [Gemmatimonadota bacterium]